MVEPVRPEKPDVGKSIGAAIVTIAIGIGVTVVAVPLLFIATCIPAVMGNNSGLMDMVIPAYFIIATIGSAAIAIFTHNCGVRWGAIVLFCLATVILLWLGLPMLR